MRSAAAVLLATFALAPRADAEQPPSKLAKLVRQIEPFIGWTEFGGRSRYAIPATIVECESHGMLHESTHPYSSSGLYQIEAATWTAYGGRRFASLPYLATKLQQSTVARRIWTDVGARAWTCAYITGWL